MASYQDLCDAIARVRAAGGDPDGGLSGEDIAAICNPLSPPGVLAAVLTKVIVAHPETFTGKVPDKPPRANEGVAADAIREAETALAQQHSDAARLDLQVVAAVLNAHTVNDEGLAELDRLQRSVEDAVLSRTGLDTPAGAREFQRFLIGTMRDIRTVVDTTGLDASSKAALAAALAALYAAAAAAEPPAGESGVRPEAPPSPPPAVLRHPGAGQDTWTDDPEPAPDPFGDLLPWTAADRLPDNVFGPPAPPDNVFGPPAPPDHVFGPPAPPCAPPTAPPTAAAPMAPAWTGGVPASPGLGLPASGLLSPDPPDLPSRGRWTHDPPVESGRREPDPPRSDTGVPEPAPPAPDTRDAADTTVELPDGQRVTAPSPQLAAVMTAAVAGTPIADAFGLQGIVLPPPGSAVPAPVDPASLLPGDVGILADRYALALGNGKALLDRQIRPIADVTGPGFLGWLHPPQPNTTAPEAPAPSQRPAQTAPS